MCAQSRHRGLRRPAKAGYTPILPKVRVALNYAIREVTAASFDSGAGPNAQLDGIGNRYGVQLTAIF